MRRLRSAALLLLLVGSACGETTAGVDPNAAPTGAYEALPACDPLAEPDPTLPAVEGLELPDGAVVTSVTAQDPLVHVTAEVAMTPVNVRRDYEERDDLEVLRSEDEIFEAELLVSNGTHRTAVTATAICRDHSVVLAVVAKEMAASVSS